MKSDSYLGEALVLAVIPQKSILFSTSICFKRPFIPSPVSQSLFLSCFSCCGREKKHLKQKQQMKQKNRLTGKGQLFLNFLSQTLFLSLSIPSAFCHPPVGMGGSRVPHRAQGHTDLPGCSGGQGTAPGEGEREACAAIRSKGRALPSWRRLMQVRYVSSNSKASPEQNMQKSSPRLNHLNACA